MSNCWKVPEYYITQVRPQWKSTWQKARLSQTINSKPKARSFEPSWIAADCDTCQDYLPARSTEGQGESAPLKLKYHPLRNALTFIILNHHT